MRFKILSLFILATLSTSLFATTVLDKVSDAIAKLNEIEKLRTSNPKLAWRLTDSLNAVEKENGYKHFPKHRIDFLYGRIASVMNRNRQAIKYFEETFKSDSVQQNPELYIRTAYLLCEELIIMQNNETAMKYILLGLERAKKENDLKNESICLGILSKVHYYNDLRDKTIETINRAIGIQEQNQNNPNVFSIDKLIAFYSVRGDYYAEYGEAVKATGSAQKGLQLLKSMSNQDISKSNLGTENYYCWMASFHSLIACMSNDRFAQQHADSAELLIRDYKILRIDVYYKILYYYLGTSQYNKAISLTNFLKASQTEQDSVNVFNQAYKSFLSQAYAGMNDYKNAYKYLSENLAITTAINTRARAEASMELAEVYEAAEKDAQIQTQAFNLKNKNRLIIFLLSWLLLLSAISYLILRSSRIVKRKNQKLYTQLKEQDKLQNELAFLKQKHQQEIIAASEQPKEASLFDRIETFLLKTQRYTDTSLTREVLAAELGTNQKYLCEAIQEAKEQTFNDYINTLRLNHARSLLTEPNSDSTIEAIAIDSGFGSRNTFYRLFRERYGLTPVEFKRLVTSKQ